MAVAGIVIGLLSFLTSFIMCFSIYYAVNAAIEGSAPARQAARQFVQNLNAGDVPAAQAQSTGSLTPAELQASSDKLRALGAFRDMTSSQINVTNTNGVSTYRLRGTATFVSGSQAYDITLTGSGRTWKVSNAQFP